MGKRAYINVASNKYRPGTEKLIRLNSHIAGHLPGSDDMRFTLEEDEDDASESVSSLNGVYNNFNVESPVIRDSTCRLDPALFQQLLQMEQDEPGIDNGFPLELDNADVDNTTLGGGEGNKCDIPLFTGCPSAPFSSSDCAMVDLIQCCNKAGTPVKFLDEFLIILKRHLRAGFDIHKAPSRANFMSRLRLRFASPKATAVISPSGVLVPKFSLLDQLVDLLASSYFQDISCCAVNMDTTIRYHQYIPAEEEGNGEVLCADWYRRTYADKIGESFEYVDPLTGRKYQNWLFPLCVYNDKTGVGAMEGKYTLEPVMFSVAVIRHDYRQQDKAWRHLGFIPNYHNGTNEEDSNDKDAEKSLSLFHELLGVLLEDLEEMQANPPLLSLNLFGEDVDIRLIIEVAFVMGDQLSQDHHCGRKKSNSGGAGRVHRACMTSFVGACKSGHEECCPVEKHILEQLYAIIQQGEDCPTRRGILAAAYETPETAGPRDPEVIAAKKNRASLESWLKVRSTIARQLYEKVYGMYPIRNAWSKISFGSNPNGIYRATLDDPMHYSSSGMFMYLATVSFKGLLPSEAKKVEKYLRQDFSNRCSVRYDFPRGKFSPGFTNCTLLTSNEKVGLMFSLYLGLGTKRIADIFEESIIRQQGKYLDVECCYANLGFSRSSLNRPPTSKLPRLGDKYFYSDIKNKKSAERAGRSSDGYEMPRNLSVARKIVNHLDSFGLLFLLMGMSSLDELQMEYLVQNIWFRSVRKDCRIYEHDLTSFPINLNCSPMERVDNDIKEQLSRNLLATLRRGAHPLSYRNSAMEGKSSTPSTDANFPSDVCIGIQKKIKKHFIDKPKLNGRGETSAILTDVNGWRTVLEHALIFHAIVHEHHHLDANVQKNKSMLSSRVSNALTTITDGLYRGDNSVDTGTCKVHSHLHLARDCSEYGSPMNYDAALGERGLKFWAKAPSRTARKCGEATFITQTSERVSDQLLLSNAFTAMNGFTPQTPIEVALPASKTWKFTRKRSHLTYNLATRRALSSVEPGQPIPIYAEEQSWRQLLLPQIVAKLYSAHGNNGTVEVWKEVLISLGSGKGTHHVRAFHQYDGYGAYFDWVNVKDSIEETEVDYVPAKALLLYKFRDECYCLCWKAQ